MWNTIIFHKEKYIKLSKNSKTLCKFQKIFFSKKFFLKSGNLQVWQNLKLRTNDLMEEIFTFLGSMWRSGHENCFLQENMLEPFLEKILSKKVLALQKFLPLMQKNYLLSKRNYIKLSKISKTLCKFQNFLFEKNLSKKFWLSPINLFRASHPLK